MISEVTSDSQVPAAVKQLRETFHSKLTRPYTFRLEQLNALKKMIEDNKEEIIHAVQQDLGKKNPQEACVTEVNLPLTEIEETIKHLSTWAAPSAVSTPVGLLPASSYVYRDPKGVVCIISPWNYPVNLALVPLQGAIAGGNTVFMKFSRHSENVGRTLAKLVPKYLDSRAVVVEYLGGASMITSLMNEKWDHVFFTGSVSVGKLVYQAAAKNLTPVTLELGGKNPCVVDKEVDVVLAARRIAFGKFFNAGQTCVAPDYILVHKDVEQEFLQALKKAITQFYGEDPQKSESFARIISKQHVERLAKLFQQGEVFHGGKSDVSDKYIAPTVLTRVKLDGELMSDEIFGPVLPVIPVDSLDDALAFIQPRPLPLAFYFFSTNTKSQEKMLEGTRSGDAVMNDCIIHFTNSNLPFGGVGESGMGAYHGHRTFDCFTHERGVVFSTSNAWLDLPLRYPPYGGGSQYLVEKITRTGW